MFATAFYAVADLASGTLRFACAGHPGGVVVADGSVRQLASHRSEKGPGLGLIPGAEFPSGSIPLGQVERVLLFTDGILEAENERGEPFLENRLMEYLRDCRAGHLDAMLDGILGRVLDFSERHHFDDDVCLLGMEVVPAPVAAGT